MLRIFYCCTKKKKSYQGRKKPVGLTAELPCRANVYVHIIKVCLFYLSHYQTGRGEGTVGRKDNGSLFPLP